MTSEIISPKKRKFIEFLKTISINKPKIPEIAEGIGISVSTYYRWLKNNELLKIVEEEKALEIEKHLPKVLEILLKKALQGDMRAIRIFLERYENNRDDNDTEENLTPDRIIEIIHNAKKETEENNSK